MNRQPYNYTLYEKRGRRYYPVKEYDSKIMDAFPSGFTLVQVEPGSTSYRYNVDPNLPEVLAACKLLEDGMLKAIREAAKYKPDPIPVTDEEREAWKNLETVLNKHEPRDQRMLRLWGCSAQDLVEAGVKYLEKYIKDQHASTV